MLGHPGHCSAVRHTFWARIITIAWQVRNKLPNFIAVESRFPWVEEPTLATINFAVKL